LQEISRNGLDLLSISLRVGRLKDDYFCLNRSDIDFQQTFHYRRDATELFENLLFSIYLHLSTSITMLKYLSQNQKKKTKSSLVLSTFYEPLLCTIKLFQSTSNPLCSVAKNISSRSQSSRVSSPMMFSLFCFNLTLRMSGSA
jgi:hypothetical protein